ncbi:alpha/beta fold hydrolase [Ralstonia pickettii]|jgi:pimeloyl-ACP methyl ester carboxylesterase|uniref:alpha/beta fold hydrolase n=1 Tax=Ralstonia pickettii TaxID=329 RepID=UPI0015FDC58F|nr:alpha/beta hydrolase [Ralstonia pickettii]MBB0026296.1 alpha/beta hydrolase [Ralstonia pickettii]MBB0037186.1 alpha/beta hydrolase [Ralstonia pickettii]MBB0099624.1 alpha/beta hydrolase [Ralstonia pickettii]MBB0109521.1 alpha/beta hydrolase [Ralstonia pickettii]MBB0130500.1 alpha/beta hydrolase [Ralstonia pickettii]
MSVQAVMSSHPFRVADALAALGAGFAERTVAINAHGDRIGYRQWGERGPVVVLLHGISSSAASWLPCAQVLSHNMRVLAWDAPGYGNSTPLAEGAPRAADYAVRLQAWVAALDVTPDAIVGHSLGALMASAYVAAAPAAMQPKCLLLLNPAQGYGQAGQEDKSRSVQAQRLATLDQLGIDGMAESRHAHLLRPDATDEERAWVRWNMKRLNDGGYRQAVAMLSGDDIGAYLKKRPESTLAQIACGDVDGITPPEGCEALAKMFDLPFALVPSAGHASYIDAPDAVAGWIEHAVLSQSQNA